MSAGLIEASAAIAPSIAIAAVAAIATNLIVPAFAGMLRKVGLMSEEPNLEDTPLFKGLVAGGPMKLHSLTLGRDLTIHLRALGSTAAPRPSDFFGGAPQVSNQRRELAAVIREQVDRPGSDGVHLGPTDALLASDALDGF